METMTKLERDLALKLLQLDSNQHVYENRLSKEKSDNSLLEAENQQLRDELAKAKADMEALRQLRDTVNKRFSTAGIGSELTIDERFNILITERNQFLERAERAESELGFATNANRNAIAENVRLVKEREDLAAKVKQLEQQPARQYLAEIADLICVDRPADFREVADAVIAIIKAKSKQSEQPRMVMRDNGRLWEVFTHDGRKLQEGDEVYSFERKWVPYNTFVTKAKYANDDSILRRPLTADELRTWLPSEQQQPGEVLFDEVADFTNGCIELHIANGLSGVRMTYQNKNGNPYRVTIREVTEKAGA